jgi:MFS family permease
MGRTATQAGQVLTPLFLGWVSASIVGVRLMLRIGYRITVRAGVALVTAAFVLMSFTQTETGAAPLLGTMALLGVGMGFTMLSLLLHVQRSVARAELGLATSLNQFARSIGGAIGVSVMGAILAAGMASGGGLHDVGGLASGSVSLDPAAREALAAALRRVFATGAAVSAVAFLLALLLPAQEGRGSVAPGSGEKIIGAEMTTLQPDDEPSVLRD